MHTSTQLRTYLDTLPRGGVKAFAARVKASPIYLQQLALRQHGRVPSPTLCVAIERESQKAVTRPNLRPDDWPDIWPELVELYPQEVAHA